MQNIKQLEEIETLIIHNNMLIKSMIGYCKHDIKHTEEISNILAGLMELDKQHEKLSGLISAEILSLK